MKNLLIRIKNSIRIALWSFVNPQVFNEDTFKMLGSTLDLILKVAKEQRPRMTHIAYIHPIDGEEHKIVSIWAGAGVGADPVKRIEELLEENKKLQELLAEQISKKRGD